MTIVKSNISFPLEPKTILWRYLSLERFISLLETKSLFFCRTDKFNDPFEGTFPRKNAIQRNDHLYKWEVWEDGSKLSDEDIYRLKNASKVLWKYFKKCVLINCWHINKVESDNFWQQYIKDTNGVAIQTTTELMYQVIDGTTKEIAMSKVKYVNYEMDSWYDDSLDPGYVVPNFNAYIHKRLEFSHENEFRLIYYLFDPLNDISYWEQQEIQEGLFIPVDIKKLIQSVYLHPQIDSDNENNIKQISMKLGYNFNFQRSKLSNEPIY